jgi:integration host factor subunit beta
MKKSDLVAALVDKKNPTEKQAMDIVNLIFKGFINELKKGGRIEIRGFGNTVDVKPKRLPFFKVGRELKKMVDGK